MKKITLICDRCKHEETGKDEYTIKNNGWEEVSFKQGGYAYERTLKDYLLCPECSKALGLFAKTDKSTTDQAHSLGDKLIEVIAEIVAEQTQC